MTAESVCVCVCARACVPCNEDWARAGSLNSVVIYSTLPLGLA